MMTARAAAKEAGITHETLSRWMAKGFLKAEGSFGPCLIVDPEKVRIVAAQRRKAEKRGRPRLGEVNA